MQILYVSIDNIFILKQLLEKRMTRNLETHLLFMNLKKANDITSFSKLWPAMKENYTLSKLIWQLM